MDDGGAGFLVYTNIFMTFPMLERVAGKRYVIFPNDACKMSGTVPTQEILPEIQEKFYIISLIPV